MFWQSFVAGATAALGWVVWLIRHDQRQREQEAAAVLAALHRLRARMDADRLEREAA